VFSVVLLSMLLLNQLQQSIAIVIFISCINKLLTHWKQTKTILNKYVSFLFRSHVFQWLLIRLCFVPRVYIYNVTTDFEGCSILWSALETHTVFCDHTIWHTIYEGNWLYNSCYLYITYWKHYTLYFNGDILVTFYFHHIKRCLLLG